MAEQRNSAPHGILFGVDENWFEAYWYGERPEGRLGRLVSVARRLAGKLAMARSVKLPAASAARLFEVPADLTAREEA
jgi:hypothetical protein